MIDNLIWNDARQSICVVHKVLDPIGKNWSVESNHRAIEIDEALAKIAIDHLIAASTIGQSNDPNIPCSHMINRIRSS